MISPALSIVIHRCSAEIPIHCLPSAFADAYNFPDEILMTRVFITQRCKAHTLLRGMVRTLVYSVFCHSCSGSVLTYCIYVSIKIFFTFIQCGTWLDVFTTFSCIPCIFLTSSPCAAFPHSVSARRTV